MLLCISSLRGALRRHSFRRKFDGARQQLPFRLLHDSFLQRFGRIALLHRDFLLKNDLSAVRDLVDVMHRRARRLFAGGEHRLVHFQSVEPLAAEFRYQRRVHVDYPLRITGSEPAGQYAHEPGEHDYLRAGAFDRTLYPVLEFLLRGALSALHRHRLDSRRPCAFESVCVRAAGNDDFHFRMRKLSSSFRVEYRLKIGASSRHEHRYRYLVHISR